MRRKLIALLGALALCLGIGVAVSPSAYAITWTNLGNVKDWVYFDSCDGDTGYLEMEVQWHFSDDYRLRVGAAHDIVIKNNSNNRIRMAQGTSNGDGSLFYMRSSGISVISAYRNGSGWMYIPAHHTSTFSADNAARWVRADGVSDSDPSPYNTYIASASDPAIEFTGFPEVYIQGAWHTCGNVPLVLEIVNNSA